MDLKFSNMLFDKSFGTIEELMSKINKVPTKFDFDCACFALLVLTKFKDAKLWHVDLSWMPFHFVAELNGKFYEKMGNQDAEKIDDFNERYGRFSPSPARIDYQSDLPISHSLRNGIHYLNAKHVTSKIKKYKTINLFDMENSLNIIKEQLFDAPVDIKNSFNEVIQYFAKKVGHGFQGKSQSQEVVAERRKALKIAEDALKMLSNVDAVNCILANGDPYIWNEDTEKIDKIKSTLVGKIEHLKKLLK